MKNITITLLLCLLMLNPIATESELTIKKDDYCTKDSLSEVNLSNSELEDLREKTENTFTDNFLDILHFLEDPENNTEDLFDSLGASASFLIIFIILTFISLIVFICLCCGLCTTDQNRTKPSTALACVAFFLFSILFIVVIVYLGLSQNKVEDTICAQFKVPSALIDGVDDTRNKFVGLANLKTTLAGLSDSLENSVNVSQHFSNIRNSNPQTRTNDAWNELSNFVEAAKTKKITDAEGLAKTPNSVLEMSKGLTLQIESEFTHIDVVAERLTSAAQEGEQLASSSGSREEIKTMIKEVNVNLQTLIDEVESVAEPGTDNVDTYVDYVLWGYWCVFGFGILLMFLSVVVLVVMCNMCSKDKCWDCLKCGRVLLVFIGFFILMFSIIVFILLIGSASISGFCGFVAEINKGNKEILNEFPNLKDNVKDIIKTCLYTDSDGDLNDLLIKTQSNATPLQLSTNFQNTNYLKSVYIFIDGFSSYRNYHNTTSLSSQSAGIIAQNKIWTNLELAKTFDFDNINSALQDLNNILSCDNKSFQFYPSQCNSAAGCQSIRDTETFTAPSCADAKANQLFINLKKYINEEVGLMNFFQESISDENNANSAQSKFVLAKNDLNGLNDAVVAIEAEFKEVFKNSSERFSAKWRDIDDCRVIRKILLQYEDKTCFEFGYYVYILMVISCVMAVLLFLMSWCICCGLRSTGEGEEEKQPKVVDTRQFETEKELDINDGEKMPFY